MNIDTPRSKRVRLTAAALCAVLMIGSSAFAGSPLRAVGVEAGYVSPDIDGGTDMNTWIAGVYLDFGLPATNMYINPFVNYWNWSEGSGTSEVSFRDWTMGANLKWAIPRDGGMIWTDNMFIPTGGSVPTASTFMNHVYDPAVAAKIAAYINYVTPVQGAKEELAKTDPKTADNPLIFPDEATLAQVKQFDSAALDNDDYITKWQQVLGQ